MKRYFILVFFNTLAFLSIGQNGFELSEKSSGIKFGNIKFGYAFYPDLQSFGGYDEMLSHLPSEDEYNFKAADNFYFNTTYYGLQYWPSPVLGISFHPSSKKKGTLLKRELSLSFSFIELDWEVDLNREVLITTGSTSVDTVGLYQASYEQSSTYLGIDLSYLYKTNPEKRLEGYIGYGIKGYSTTYNVLSRYENVDTFLLNSVTGIRTYLRHSQGYRGSYINTDIGKSYIIQPYVLAGINFRFTQNTPVLKRIRLSCEMNAGANYQTYERGGNTWFPYINLSGCLKYVLTN